MRWQRAARVLGLAASGVLLGHAATFVACVDGTTPDCSDAASQCGPDLDGASGDVLEAALPETSPPSDAPSDAPDDTASSADAEPDADLDAGDEG